MNSAQGSFTRGLRHSHAAHANEQTNGGEGLSNVSRLSPRSYCVIVDTTISMLRDVGYHQLTIEGVAATAGVDTVTIYLRWTTKASLVVEAIGHRLRQVHSMCGDPEKDIRAMVLNLIEIFNDAVPCALPAFAGSLANDPSVAEKLAAVLGTYRPSNAAALIGAVRHGELSNDSDITDVLDVIAGTIFYRRLMHQPVDDTLVEQLTKLALTGQLPRLNPSAAACLVPTGRSSLPSGILRELRPQLERK